MGTAIEVENVSKTYLTHKRGKGLFRREPTTVTAVDDVSFTIEAGEICGVLGPNGAGKSTTIKMLCGALLPTSGTVRVLGYEPFRDRRRYVQEIGAVFGQKSQLIWDIPPVDSFLMNKAIYGVPAGQYRETLDELVSLLDVADKIEVPARVLSLGERMKCEFIMAMLHRPRVVFLDEPTIGLDTIAKAAIRDFVRGMQERGTTFLLTTHDLEDVERLAEHVVIIGGATKVFDGSLPDLRRSLGETKIVELTLARPASEADLEGLCVVGRRSDREMTIEIDISLMGPAELFATLSRRLEIKDISIRELPMERVITEIYTSSRR
ncbi:ABC transporter ATP-binding protein [Xylanimonas sp. McL0601]|uniref:ABC transporter ATP-binding protein n=1 Tax=Xylanimonas sp. McL0601 TaxID=3414739 RepID=UPI003CF14766